ERERRNLSFTLLAGQGRVPPHIVFVMVEDQGIGYHGSEIHTPVLDQLAGERVKLENYYVQPICSPSCSQLMTGRYQIHTGLQHSIIHARQPLCLPPNIPTLPERLRQAGYSTHMVGKWHLGFCRPECLPTSRGFQSFLGSLTGKTPTICEPNTVPVKEILRGHDQWTPLFLYVALQAVHTPLQAPGHLLRHYQTLGHRPLRHYAAMVSGVDESVGMIVSELRERGYYNNSVLIYSSDSGGQPVSWGCNWPLRGGKGSYWEGGVRAVGFVHSPLLKTKGVVSQALIHVSDWYPTLLTYIVLHLFVDQCSLIHPLVHFLSSIRSFSDMPLPCTPPHASLILLPFALMLVLYPNLL
uniref:Si:dkey-174i8.1 n=1 Tax=Cyprinus carpio TaxID=7962 RepID=A0A8C2KBT5_CYPCA